MNRNEESVGSFASAPTIDRVSPCRRPAGRAIGYHQWSNLLFVHWRVPAESVQRLLPAGLTVDTWGGDAWVGLVPFAMSGIRPWWSPPVPGVSAFLETNVRTYVHAGGEHPGVWFFSLEASSSLAVRVARRRWQLPYYRARMSLTREPPRVRYASRRLWPGPTGYGNEIEAEVAALVEPPAIPPDASQGKAVPETLEHFLIERYTLYAQSATGRLLRGRVHHAPYEIREARLTSFHDTLVSAAGITPEGPPCHVVFCEGVKVEVFPLVEVAPKRSIL